MSPARYDERGEESMTPVHGPTIPGFPFLSLMTHGMVGVIVIIGGTEVGKSHLVTQLATSVAGPDFPVVVCDMENRAGSKSLNKGRANRMFGPADPRLHYVWDARTFEEGAKTLREQEGNEQTGRGLLVVDTLQKSLGLPDDGADTGERAVAGERRMRECERLVDEGYTVLITSQVGRGYQKGRPSLTSAKWSSAIEQSAWTVLSYWIASDGSGDRLLAAEKLRQDPPDTRLREAVLVLKDGPDHRVTEHWSPAVAVPISRPKKLTSAERVAQARLQHPDASVRKIAELAKVGKSYAHELLLRVSAGVSGADSTGQHERTAQSPALAQV
jgi:hypothetical protein